MSGILARNMREGVRLLKRAREMLENKISKYLAKHRG
jgi:hypothetical protein